MKMNRLLFILLALLMPVFCLAQPGDPGGNPDVPITGIEYLIGGGALLGARALLKRMKQKGD